ncbi:hypothetical protein AOLI_G00269330 [Acnodon oligacanthus]
MCLPVSHVYAIVEICDQSRSYSMADSQYFLWLVLVGVIVTTLTIVLIFILINVCISKHAARRRAQISRTKQNVSSHEVNSLFTTHTDEEKPPPLPSRDQFLVESRSHSYEEMDACVELVKAEVQTLAPPQPPFIQHCETQLNLEDGKSVSESYDDIEQLNQDVAQSYEDVASLPDYLELEEEPPALQEEPEFHNVQTDSQESLASYDDIDALDNASEDYDDVG